MHCVLFHSGKYDDFNIICHAAFDISLFTLTSVSTTSFGHRLMNDLKDC